MLENGVYRVKYVLPNGVVHDCQPAYNESDWYQRWLNEIIKMIPDSIFFLVAETTDVFED